jgi:hypothetical protein
MEKKIETLTDLINDLSDVYSDLRNETITVEKANAAANVSSKLIKAATSQLRYNEYLSKTEEIDFFKTQSKP